VLTVGLTGNVASGKSAVARHFAEWGATVIDADQLVREVQRPGHPVTQAIEDRFGSDAVRPDGTLDRSRLRAIVMGDTEARADLEGIVHPAVQARRMDLVHEAAARGDLVVVNDIPLLFEVLDPAAFDLIVLVDAPEDVRRHRLTALRGLSAAEADRLIGAQLPSEPKRALSHVVLDNDGTLADLERACRDAWDQIRRRAAAEATVPGSTIVAVLAHGDDVAAMHGTLQRYAAAGVRVHVVSGSGQCPAGLATTATSLGLRAGAMAEAEASASARIEQLLAAERPAAVVTFGPDGGNGHPDHRAVHRWTRRAVATSVARPALYFIASRDANAEGAGGAVTFAAALDVRPWLDRSASVADCGIAASAEARSGREWFASDPPPTTLQWDLLAPRNPG